MRRRDHHTITGQDRDLLPIPRSKGGQTINGPITMEMIRRLSATLAGVAGWNRGPLRPELSTQANKAAA
jgi:hypothetical protein